jgi:hypothetical protein
VSDLRDEGDEFERKRIMERLTACHYSILHVIEKAAGVSAKAFAAKSYMPDALNPHRKEVDFVSQCKERIASLRGSGGKTA